MPDAKKDAAEMAEWLRNELPWALQHIRADTPRAVEATKEVFDRCATAAEMLDVLSRAA